MATDDKLTGPIPDPDNVPVTFANVLFGGGTVNGVINVTLGVTRFTPTFEGKTNNDIVIASRLRLDLQAATNLRDFLDSQIKLMSAGSAKPN